MTINPKKTQHKLEDLIEYKQSKSTVHYVIDDLIIQGTKSFKEGNMYVTGHKLSAALHLIKSLFPPEGQADIEKFFHTCFE